jgi:HD-GYP domain-containing protein (c-di-GMP phosphodiesterase class II)
MLHDRPYRRALTLERVREEIAAGAGTQFDPEAVRAFETLTDVNARSLVSEPRTTQETGL